MIVVDSSVICGFVISSDAYHAGAVACRDRDPEWHAPFLSHTEFRSVAAGYLRKGEPLATLMEAGALAVMSVQAHHPTDAEVFSVLGTSALSAYDAEYVALAQRLHCKLITTDKEVLKCYPELAVRLADYAAGV
jgi:predicted nucleic acid-binding protein